MKQIRYFILHLIFFILKLDINFAYFERGISLEKSDDIKSNTEQENSCTCDLTNHCDYRCCCDNDCEKTQLTEWRENDKCLNYHKSIIEDFKCKSRKNNFKYNNEKAGLTVNDHIYNIMCIQFVRSGEMRNSYLEIDDKVEKDMNDYKTNWEKNFFKDNNDSEDYVNSILKADSNGNCIKQFIHYLLPFESSCIVESKDLKLNSDYTKDGNKLNVINITKTITEQKKIIKFRVEWKHINENGNKNYPLGYLQGNPINIGFKNENEDTYNIYERGFFITMATKNGKCAENIDEDIISYPILFKRNGMYSCQINGNIRDTFFYKTFINKQIRIGCYKNSIFTEDDSKSLDIDKTMIENNYNNNILIYLLIFTSKKGEENSYNEYIHEVKSNVTLGEENSPPIISLIIKYFDISPTSIIKSKEQKIFSFNIPKNILDILSDKKN